MCCDRHGGRQLEFAKQSRQLDAFFQRQVGRLDLLERIANAIGQIRRARQVIAITEHGEDLTINGLSREEVRAEAAALERLRNTHPDLTILHGSELNIPQGRGLS